MDSYIKERRFIGYKEVVRFIKDIVGALAYTHHDIYRFLMNPEEDNLEVDPQDGSKYLIDDAKEKEPGQEIWDSPQRSSFQQYNAARLRRQFCAS